MSDAMPARVPVTLVQKYGIYNAGEVAGFPPEESAQMIADGIAVAYDAQAAQGPGAETFVPAPEGDGDEATEAPRAKKGK